MMPAVAKAAHLWERDALDFYVEPVAATEALLAVERFVGPVWDPACGSGNIIRALRDGGYLACGSDIKNRLDDRPFWFRGEFDFLAPGTPVMGSNIITNPPFFRAKGTEAFIRRALAVASGKVAVFADLKFLAGSARANGLYAEHPPSRVWIITPRPSCPPGAFLAAGNEAGGGTADWCWLVWDRTAPAAGTQLGWLRRK